MRHSARCGLVRALAVVTLPGACGTGDPPDDGDDGDDGDARERSMASSPLAAAPLPAPAPTAQRCRTTAADVHAAEAMARACGSSVEVASERSEYAEVYVEPSGSRTVVAALVPQRARRADGTWSAIDTTFPSSGRTRRPMARPARRPTT
jgi:hypothetical protein